MGLHLACALGRPEKVRQLIERGHDVNAYDRFGWTPLLRAAAVGHVKVVRELIRANADVNLKTRVPDSTVLRALHYCFIWLCLWVIHPAMKLIAVGGFGMDDNDFIVEGKTALMLAVESGHSAVVAELIKEVPGIDLKGEKGMHAILLAKNYDMVCQLTWDVDHLSREDRSLILWHACDAGDLTMVHRVIEAGCDVDHIHRGQSPVVMATLRGHENIVRELILANCDVNLRSETYLSDMTNIMDIVKMVWPAALIWILAVVTYFRFLALVYLGRELWYYRAPRLVNPGTGSEALTALAYVFAWTLFLPMPWRTATYLFSLSYPLLKLVMEAAATLAGPVVWIVALLVVVMAILALLTWGPRANMPRMMIRLCGSIAVGYILTLVVLHMLILVYVGWQMQDWLIKILILVIVIIMISAVKIKIMVIRKTIAVVGSSFLVAVLLVNSVDYTSGIIFLSCPVFLVMFWSLDYNTPSVTALHYAACRNRIKCGVLLVEAGANVGAMSRFLGTPLDIGSKQLVNEIKQTLSFAAKRIIAVIGHAECGKSTLIAALEAEGKSWWMYIINWFRKVRDNRQRTAGIEAIEFSSRKYGEALFYDFAGQTQYHSPHQSFLEAMLSKPGVSVALLLLVKATAEEDIITQQLFHWLHPLVQMSAPSTLVVMVVGSFLDEAESGQERSAKKEAHEKLLRCIQSAQQEFPFQIKGPCLLDCRQPESRGINKIRSFLQTAKPLHLKPKHVPHNMVLTKPLICYNLHWVLVQLRKTFSIPALRFHVFQEWLQDNARNLPMKLPPLEEVCQDLSAAGHTLFLPNKQDPSQSWLILNLPTLLHDVYGTLFSGTQAKVNQFGLLPCSQLAELFPELDLKMIQEVLVSLEFCIEIDPFLLRVELSELTMNEGKEGWLCFPALVSAEPPEVFPEDPDPEQFQWMCWQLRASNKHFFFVRLLHTIILRLAAKHVSIQEPFPGVREHCCSIWVNGIFWSSIKGVDIAVQICDCSVVQVLGRSQAGTQRLQEYMAAIVQDVTKTIAQISLELNATPYIVHPCTPRLLVDSKVPQSDSLYLVSSINDCITRGGDHVQSRSRNARSIPIRRLFGGKVPSLSTVQALNYPKGAPYGELGFSQRGRGTC